MNSRWPQAHPENCPPLAIRGGRHGTQHQPVLLKEVLQYLTISPNGKYIDATFGRGGHANAILKQLDQGKLLVIDKDIEAIKAAEAIKDKRMEIRAGSFTKLKDWVTELKWVEQVDGILLDLGVSSPQLDDKNRGFSFMHDGPLDMRMDLTQQQTAATWLNFASSEEISEVLRKYGEERFHRRIAEAIVSARKISPITTTEQLATIVKHANPRWEKHKNPATRTFQAIRIYINNELEELGICLDQCLEVLKIGGRLAMIAFQSLEVRKIRQFIYKYTHLGNSFGLPIVNDEFVPKLKYIAKSIKPSTDEIDINPRARSASLHVAEKIA